MVDEKELKFECRECGSHELGYQKYARCITPVSLQEKGNVEYGQSAIHEDDYLATLNGFACTSCKCLIEHCGFRMETERQLVEYLTMDSDVRQQQQHEYEDLMSDQIYAQEQKDKEQNAASATMDIFENDD